LQVKLHAQFLENLLALTGVDQVGDGRLGIAVSGGPDSMALLALAHKVWGPNVDAATVDHQLRDESRAEADMVAAFCKRHGVGHSILIPDKPIAGNIQSEARAVRYGLLGNWAEETNLRWIATAHHADDQLETILMRLARGAGLDGLSGVRPRNGQVIRPLLNVAKADLIAYCDSEAIPYVSDPSNKNDDYDRVRMRNALEKLDMLDVFSAGRSAAALADARDALQWVIAREADAHITMQNGCVTLANTQYPREIQRRLLLYCLHKLEPDLNPRGDTQTRALDALHKGEKTMIGDILCEGGAQWTFRPAPPRMTN